MFGGEHAWRPGRDKNDDDDCPAEKQCFCLQPPTRPLTWEILPGQGKCPEQHLRSPIDSPPPENVRTSVHVSEAASETEGIAEGTWGPTF